MSLPTSLQLQWIPSAALGQNTTPSATPWANGAWAQISASTGGVWTIGAVSINAGAANGEFELDIGVGASGSETVVTTLRGTVITLAGGNVYNLSVPYGPIASGSRVSARLRTAGSTTTAWRVALGYYQGTFDSTHVSNQAQLAAPSAAAGVSVTPSASAWASSAYTEVLTAAPADIVINSVPFVPAGTAAVGYEIDIATGASGSETVLHTIRGRYDSNVGSVYNSLPVSVKISSGSRIAVRLRKNNTDVTAWKFAITYQNIGANVGPTPSLVTADAFGFTGTLTPTLAFTGTDPDSDPINYELQVDTVNTFNSTTPTPAFVQSATPGTNATGATNTTATSAFSSANRAHNAILVGAIVDSVSGTTSVVDTAGNTYTLQAKFPTSGNRFLELWGCFDIKAQSSNIITVNQNFSDSIAFAHEYSGLATTGIDQVANASGTNASPTATTGTTTTAKELVLSILELDVVSGNSINSAGTGYGNFQTGSSNFVRGGIESKVVTSTGAQTGTFNVTNAGGGTWRIIVATFPAAAAPIVDALSANDSGFVDTTNGADTAPFASGDQIGYTLQGPLLGGTTYYWRVRAVDPAGTNTWSSWTTTRSFTARPIRTHTTDTYTRSLTQTRTHTTDVYKLPGSSVATPAYVQSAIASGNSTTGTPSLTSFVGGHAMLVSGGSSGTWSAPTDNQGTTYTLLQTYNQNKVYIGFPASSGTVTVTVNFTSGSTNIIITEISGVDSTSPLDTVNNATGSNSIPTLTTSTTSQANDLMVALVSMNNNVSETVGSGWSNFVSSTGQTICTTYQQTKLLTSATTTTAPFGSSSFFNWYETVIGLKPASVAGNRPQARRHTTDVYTRPNIPQYTRTHSTDTLKRAAVSKTHTTDTLKRKATTKTHTTDVYIRRTPTKTHTTDVFRRLQGVRTHTTDTYLRSVANYTRGNATTLPTTNADLTTAFNSAGYTTVATDNGVYVGQTGAAYMLFEFKYENTNSTDGITITWNGNSTKAPSTSTVYLQIWNYNTSAWETLASNSVAAANTDFTLTGVQLTNMANYYSSNIAIARVYQ